MSDHDITHLLGEWPFERGRVNARRITGADGRDLVQLRVDLGLLQMELEGRPDGQRQEGCESLLGYQVDRLDDYRRKNGEQGFVLSSDECRALREEAVQYYHRYIALFVLGDYECVVRDTNRNLQVFDLCRDYGQTEADRNTLEQFRPHLIMMRARAEAEISIGGEDPRQALVALDRGLTELQLLFEDLGIGDALVHSGEAQLLRGMREALVPRLPVSQRAELEERIKDAIAEQNYELAAILRDELRMME